LEHDAKDWSTVSSNKAEADGHLVVRKICAEKLLLAGHGGEGEKWVSVVNGVRLLLLAGRGGEGENQRATSLSSSTRWWYLMVLPRDAAAPLCSGSRGGDQDWEMAGSGGGVEDGEASRVEIHKRRLPAPLLSSADGATPHLLSCSSQDLSSSNIGGFPDFSTAHIAASAPSGSVPGVEKVAVAARSTMVSAEEDLIAFPIFPQGPFRKKQGLHCNFLLFLDLACICNLPS
jgi:hypothetical protein